MLDGNKVVSGDDPLMVVTIDALWPIPSVFPSFVGQIVGGKRLAGKDIPAMALIPEHLYNRVRGPIHIAQIGFAAQLRQCGCNFRR